MIDERVEQLVAAAFPLARDRAGFGVDEGWIRADLRMTALVILNRYGHLDSQALRRLMFRSAGRVGARCRHRLFGHTAPLVPLDYVVEEVATGASQPGVVVTLRSSAGTSLASELLTGEQLHLGLTIAALGTIEDNASRLYVGQSAGERLKLLYGVPGRNVPVCIEVEHVE